jgi:hypothetical protein
MNVLEQTAFGLQVLDLFGVDAEKRRRVARVIHPKVKDEAEQDVMAGTWAYMFVETQEPLTVDNIARQFADKWGAFPWDGPVGNGLTRDHYRAKFREMADEHLFAWQQLGLLGENA